MTENTPDRLDNLVVGEGVRVLNPAYSKLVRWLRLVLPLVAVIIVVMLFTWSMLDRNTVVAEKSDDGDMNQASNELVSARFESRDSSGRPYVITAERAVQGRPEQGQDDKTIYLDGPHGEMTLESGEKIEVKAANGAYQQEREELNLNGGVHFGTTDGYRANTEEVFVHLKNSQAQSSSVLEGEGPAGSVRAQGFPPTMKKADLF
ncbi:MAG: LPS export ABC transporter periplasmic protein LptC [Alphaproteobacteria bacterium]|nr:LPS export ABC transporter periplasmic protein LptC [Alphaproteobacteria bacterium]